MILYFQLMLIHIMLNIYGLIAQLVEQRTENPRVGGSIPSLGIPYPCGCGTMASTSAFQAEDVGSIPITRFCSTNDIYARVAQW